MNRRCFIASLPVLASLHAPLAHAQAPAVADLLDQRLNELLAQVFEVMRLAEEARDVGGQGSDHLGAFLHAVL